jgi:tetratricopeptide (TPR) repeat protein
MHTLHRCVVLDPNQLEAYDLLARIYAGQGWIPLVEKTYQTILSRDSTNVNAYYNLALLYLRKNQRDKAVAMYQKILSVQDPSDGDTNKILLGLGDLYLDMGKYKEAIDVYNQMIKINPKAGTGYHGLGLAEEGLQDTAQAIINYERALQQDSTMMQTRARLGRIYQARAQWNDAQKLIEGGITQDSTNFPLWLELGDLYRRKEDSTATVQTYQEIVHRFPDQWEGYLDQGRVYLDWQEFALARQSFDKVIEINPDNAWGWLFGGISLVLQDSLKSSIPYLEKAIDSLPEDPLGNYYLGSVYMQEARFKEAKPLLLTALKRRPKWVSAMSALATVYDGLKEYLASDSLYEAAIALDSTNVLLLNNFAYSLSERGVRLDEALTMSQEALENDPENGAYLDTMGWIHFKLGNYEKAIDYIQQALDKRPDNAEVMEHLGDVYEKLGQFEKAVACWNKALALDKTNSTLQNKIERHATE